VGSLFFVCAEPPAARERSGEAFHHWIRLTMGLGSRSLSYSPMKAARPRPRHIPMSIYPLALALRLALDVERSMPSITFTDQE
jgi:hypothetical protein